MRLSVPTRRMLGEIVDVQVTTTPSGRTVPIPARTPTTGMDSRAVVEMIGARTEAEAMTGVVTARAKCWMLTENCCP